MRVGLIGNGLVGSVTGAVLREYGADILAYDMDPEKSTHSRAEVLACDWVLLCVQTPGEYDPALKILKAAAAGVAPEKLVIRSTVPPSMYRELGSPTVWPEFLTARTALEDTRKPSRIVIGGPRAQDFARVVIDICWPRAPLFVFENGEDACRVKFACNVFGAIKVTYWNVISKWVGGDPENYRAVLEACLASGWIAPMHTAVPGPDGKLGFGGACLPKDTALLAGEFAKMGWFEEAGWLSDALKLNTLMRDGAPVHAKE